MLLIPCPNCGPRLETEFVLGGPCRARRPDDPSAFDDEAWVDYLVIPPNPMGPLPEKWYHARGCGAWFNVVRDTVTHQILQSGADHG